MGRQKGRDGSKWPRWWVALILPLRRPRRITPLVGLGTVGIPRTPYLQYHGVRSYLVQGTPLYLLRGTPLYLLRGTPLYLCKDLDRVGLWIVHVA